MKYSFENSKKQEECSSYYIDENDVAYDTAQDYLIFKKLKLCGCGMPENNLEFVTAFLSLINERMTTKNLTYEEYSQKRQQLFDEYKDAVHEIILNWLTNLNIIEHGGSVYGSWISDEYFFKDCCTWFHEDRERDECEHESDRECYPPLMAQYKCKKCGEFYK